MIGYPLSHWLNKTNLELETFILKGTEVKFPTLFSEKHDEYLVSIKSNPAEAARWWLWQSDKCFPGEGWVSYKVNDVQAMPMDTWTNTRIFWQETLEAIEEYLKIGAGQGSFSEEQATFSITRKGDIAIFELRGNKYLVEPDSFIKSLLESCQDFFFWEEKYIGRIERRYLEKTKTLLDSFSL